MRGGHEMMVGPTSLERTIAIQINFVHSSKIACCLPSGVFSRMPLPNTLIIPNQAIEYRYLRGSAILWIIITGAKAHSNCQELNWLTAPIMSSRLDVCIRNGKKGVEARHAFPCASVKIFEIIGNNPSSHPIAIMSVCSPTQKHELLMVVGTCPSPWMARLWLRCVPSSPPPPPRHRILPRS